MNVYLKRMLHTRAHAMKHSMYLRVYSTFMINNAIKQFLKMMMKKKNKIAIRVNNKHKVYVFVVADHNPFEFKTINLNHINTKIYCYRCITYSAYRNMLYAKHSEIMYVRCIWYKIGRYGR